MFRKLLTSVPRNVMRTYLPIPRVQYYFSSNNNQTALLEEVEGKVFEILKTAAKCDQSKLTKKASFEELGFDSLDSVELVVAMEENFGIDIPNE